MNDFISFQTTTVKLTRETAAKWLSTSKNSRTIDRKKVSNLRDDIERSGYINDGKPFCFNLAKQLIDGQHRLSALLESKLEEFPVVVVVYGFELESST